MLPVWQKVVAPFVKSGEVVVLGVTQEQHPDRTRLYRQWRGFDWPILIDSLNLLDVRAVPIPVAIDSSGIVRHTRLRPGAFVEEFLSKQYPPTVVTNTYNRAAAPDLDKLAFVAREGTKSDLWRALGDALYVHGGLGKIDLAIEAYQRALAATPNDGRSQFRLGVALLSRFESSKRQLGDAQAAVDWWGRSLAADPNQYIWARRIQQYGPRLNKPYNFYFWVDKARKEILARGETPFPLPIEPAGSELAPPQRGSSRHESVVLTNPDPDGRIHQDTQGLVVIDSVVTPARPTSGGRARVRVVYRLSEELKPLWNNEFDGLRMWLDLPDGIVITEGSLSFSHPTEPETRELRVLECEVAIDASLKAGKVDLPAYALYDVCTDEDGVCHHLRQDFRVSLRIVRH